jgi:hypothetical protein
VFALCISIIGGTAFIYMIHAHSGAWRWMYTSAAMLFLTGIMVAYDELFVPSITCPMCGRTSYHQGYCGALLRGLRLPRWGREQVALHRARSPKDKAVPASAPRAIRPALAILQKF